MNKINHKTLLHDFVKSEIEKEKGYRLLSEYKRSKDKLKVKCNKDHIFYIRYDAWKSQKHRCPFCSGNARLTYEFVKHNIEKEGYKLLSTDYVNNNKKLEVQCSKGHKYKVRWMGWKRGIRCMKCFISCKRSNAEKEIAECIKVNYKGIIRENDRKIIKNPITNYFLELDFLLPELRKAIEVNGEYYHSDNYTIWKDKYKQQWCKDNNIDLIVLSVKDYYKNKEKELNKIKNFILG